MRRTQTLGLMLIFLTFFGCEGNGQIVKKPDDLPVKTIEPADSNSAAKIGEPFTLKNNESAKVEVANMQITVNRIGRKWLADGGGESLDFTFTVKHDKKTERYSSPLPDSITAGSYKIEVLKTEPFGFGYAIFLVTKNNSGKQNAVEKSDSNDRVAAKFVEKFSWHIDEFVSLTKIEMKFPNNFNGLRFYHYQAASKSSGVDLNPLLGKKVEILKYMLKEKQETRGSKITNFAHLIIGDGAVVGAWQTDSSGAAPGDLFVQEKVKLWRLMSVASVWWDSRFSLRFFICAAEKLKTK